MEKAFMDNFFYVFVNKDFTQLLEM